MADEKENPEEETEEEESGSPEDLESILSELGIGSGEENAENKEEESSTPEAEKEETEKEPETPQIDFSRLLEESPEARDFLSRAVQDALAAKDAEGKRDEQTKELQRLVSEGDNAALGEMVASELKRVQAKSGMTEEILVEFLGPVYSKMFAGEDFKGLSAEDKQRIDPRMYKTDVDYLLGVMDFRVERAVKARDAVLRKEIEAELTKAEGSAETVRKVKAASAVGLPSGSASKNEPTTAAGLLEAGWAEVLAGAGYKEYEE